VLHLKKQSPIFSLMIFPTQRKYFNGYNF